ncbi:hypothetical protein [Aurantibacter sp.]|uniref:hypothetical protein n=1 Tax=Aurantibacter sp. TaxID=2807103 RepID=UPI00326587AA
MTTYIRRTAIEVEPCLRTSDIKNEKMDVINTIVQNSSLNGMPKWYKATAILLFSTIVTLLATMLVLLFIYGPEMNIKFGY